MRSMMRSVRRGIRYVVVGLVLVGAVAGSAFAAAPFGQYYEYVYKVQAGNDNYLYINVIKEENHESNFSPSHGCPLPFFARSAYLLSDIRTRAWMQLATASLLSHTRVYVHTNGTCTPGGYLIMDLLQLEE